MADLTPQALAERVRDAMWDGDHATKMLGMRITEVGPGRAVIEMMVRPDMLNGHAICHGGLITTLADSAFAFACNAFNELTVASSLSVDLVAPAREGDVLTAQATPLNQAGRTGVYDMVVTNQRGERVAFVRGRSYTVKGKPVVELPVGAPTEAPPPTSTRAPT